MSIKSRHKSESIFTKIKEKLFKSNKHRPAEVQASWFPGVSPVATGTSNLNPQIMSANRQLLPDQMGQGQQEPASLLQDRKLAPGVVEDRFTGFPRPPNAGWKVNALHPPDTSQLMDTTRVVTGAIHPSARTTDATGGLNTARAKVFKTVTPPITSFANRMKPQWPPARDNAEAAARSSTARVSPPPITRNNETGNELRSNISPAPDAQVDKKITDDQSAIDSNRLTYATPGIKKWPWLSLDDSSGPTGGANDEDVFTDQDERRKSIPIYDQHTPIRFPFSQINDLTLCFERDKLIHNNSRVAVLVADPAQYQIKIHATTATRVEDGTLCDLDMVAPDVDSSQLRSLLSPWVCAQKTILEGGNDHEGICEDVHSDVEEHNSSDQMQDQQTTLEDQANSATICIPTECGNLIKVDVHVDRDDTFVSSADVTLQERPDDDQWQSRSASPCLEKLYDGLPCECSEQAANFPQSSNAADFVSSVGFESGVLKQEGRRDDFVEERYLSTCNLYSGRWSAHDVLSSDSDIGSVNNDGEECLKRYRCEHVATFEGWQDQDICKYFETKLECLERLLVQYQTDNFADGDGLVNSSVSLTSARCPFSETIVYRSADTTSCNSIYRLSDDLLRYYQKALSCGYACWSDCFLVLVGRHLATVSRGPAFLKLDVVSVGRLLQDDLLDVEKESVVFRAAHRWLRYEEDGDRSQHAAALLRSVRFGLMSAGDLVRCCVRSCLSHHLLMSNVEDASDYRSTLLAAFSWRCAVDAHIEGFVEELETQPRARGSRHRSPGHEQTNAELDRILRRSRRVSATNDEELYEESSHEQPASSRDDEQGQDSLFQGRSSSSESDVVRSTPKRERNRRHSADIRLKLTKYLKKYRKCREEPADAPAHHAKPTMTKKGLRLFPPQDVPNRCRYVSKREIFINERCKPKSVKRTEDCRTAEREEKRAMSSPSSESLGIILDQLLNRTKHGDESSERNDLGHGVGRSDLSPTSRREEHPRGPPSIYIKIPDRCERQTTDGSLSSSDAEAVETDKVSIADDRELVRVSVARAQPQANRDCTRPCDAGMPFKNDAIDKRECLNVCEKEERSSRRPCKATPPAAVHIEKLHVDLIRSPKSDRCHKHEITKEQVSANTEKEKHTSTNVTTKEHTLTNLARDEHTSTNNTKEEHTSTDTTHILYGLAPFAKCVVAPERQLCTALNPYPCSAVVVLGGLNPLDSWDDEDTACGILRLRVTGGDWEPASPLPEPFMLASACLVPGYGLFVSGGVTPKECNGGRQLIPQGHTWRYNAGRRCWKRLANMAEARLHHAMAPLVYPAELMQGEEQVAILAIGGQDRNMRSLSSVEAYDPVLDTWSDFLRLPAPRMAACATSFVGGVWVCGGMREASASSATHKRDDRSNQSNFSASMIVLDEVIVFEPTIGKWLPRTPLRVPRCLANLVVLDRQLIILGGATCPDTSFDQSNHDAQKQSKQSDGLLQSLDAIDAYIWDPSSWQQVAQLNRPRQGSCSVVMDDCTLLVIGGLDSKGLTALSSVELYDNNLNTVGLGPNLPRPLLGFTAVLVPPLSSDNGNLFGDDCE